MFGGGAGSGGDSKNTTQKSRKWIQCVYFINYHIMVENLKM